MLKSLFAILALSTLAGCGAGPHLAAPLAPSQAAGGSAGRAEAPGVAAAERAIRASIEKRIPDYNVSLQTLQVAPATVGTVFTFTAQEQVSGLGGSRRFLLQGSYDAHAAAVKVEQRQTLQ